MRLEVNGAVQDITATTLSEALTELGWDAARVATALNGTFVSRDTRATTVLKEGDRLEVLAPMQGG